MTLFRRRAIIGSPALTPTDLGFTEVGASNFTTAFGIGKRYIIPADATLTGIVLYTQGAGLSDIAAALYDDSGNDPNNLLGSSPLYVDGASTLGWYQMDFSAPISIVAGTYWAIIYHQDACLHYYDDDASELFISWSKAYPFPATINKVGSVGRKVSLYLLGSYD